MSRPVIIQGTLQQNGTLKLDQPSNLPPGPVVVTVQPVTAPSTRGLVDVIDEIHKGQQARGYQGRSAEEIDAVRQEGEAEYEQRMQSANHLAN